MKVFFGLAVLSLSLCAVASTDTKTFVYDGSEKAVELILNAEKSHTEYKVEEVPSTCYRQEIRGYTTTCMSGNYRPYPNGYPGNFQGGYYDPRNRYPQPGPRFPRSGTCIQQPVYRSVPYACVKTERTGYQVKDYDVEAKVTINISSDSQLPANEKFTVVLSGDLITMSVTGSKNYLIVQTNKAIDSKIEGAVKSLVADYKIELVEAAPVVAALNMTKIKIEDGSLKFDLGPVTALENLGMSLYVEKRKAGADQVLINRELMVNETKLDRTLEKTDVEINLSKVAGLPVLENGKFEITPKVYFKPRGNLLNIVQFGDEALSTSRTLIYKNR